MTTTMIPRISITLYGSDRTHFYKNVSDLRTGNNPGELLFTTSSGQAIRTTLPYLIIDEPAKKEMRLKK